jgi:hypothetical protein
MLNISYDKNAKNCFQLIMESTSEEYLIFKFWLQIKGNKIQVYKTINKLSFN